MALPSTSEVNRSRLIQLVQETERRIQRLLTGEQQMLVRLAEGQDPKSYKSQLESDHLWLHQVYTLYPTLFDRDEELRVLEVVGRAFAHYENYMQSH